MSMSVHTRLREQSDEIARLKAELAKHQESEFHPDWSMLKETRASLREHMAELKIRRAASKLMSAKLLAIVSVITAWEKEL